MAMYQFKPEDAFRFAREKGIPTFQRGRELVFQKCPYCGEISKDKLTFAINLDTGQFNCKRASCGATGNMTVIAKDFGFSLGTEVDEYYQPRKRYRKFKKPEKKFIPKDPAVKYLESRGIPKEVTERYEITTKGADNIIAFPFYDENGELTFIKYRKTDFDKTKDKNKEWCESNCKPILFGMNQCTDFERLVITEGQIDSLSVAAAGIENAVSVPTGANGFTWVPYCWDWITKFKEIVVFGDHEHDHITLLDELNIRFPNKIMHVREEDYKDCKDANEILQKYGKQAVADAVNQAIVDPIKQLIPLSKVQHRNIYDVEKLKTGITKLDRMLYGGIPFGGLCVIAAKRGSGKSTFAGMLAAQAVEQGYTVMAYSGEMVDFAFKEWIDYQIAGRKYIIDRKNVFGDPYRYITNTNQALIDRWYDDKIFLYDNRIVKTDERKTILDTVKSAIVRNGARVILIDNLMTAMYEEDLDEFNKFDRQGRFVQELAGIAVDYDCLIILVAHKRKGESDDENDDIAGSSDITNLSSLILTYEKGKDEHGNDLPDYQRKLKVTKNRLFGITNYKGFIVNYDDVSKRIYMTEDELNRQYGWIDQGDLFTVAEDEDIPFD